MESLFCGSTNEVLENIKLRSGREYPHVTVGYFSPPYKSVLSKKDNQVIIKKVNTFKPDIVFAGMTCPKQEKWSYRMKDQLNTKLICCIGAVFDWYGGKVKEIKPIWWKLRLGWLIRTIDRPEILKRYPNVFVFFWHLLKTILGLRKINNGK